METDFLTWTREHETSTKEPFIWKSLNNGVLKVLGTGLIEFIPNTTSAKQVVYSCGIHGNETGPIEIINDIISDITNAKLECVEHTLFIIGNPRAMNLEKRFCSENLNRLFARDLSSKEDNYDVLRAKEIIEVMDNFFDDKSSKIHYDLHTAIKPSELQKFAIYPFTPGRDIDIEQLGFLEDSGIDAVVFSNSKATTFSYHSSMKYGASSFTLELGKVQRFGENNRESFKDIENTLRQILEGKYKKNEKISKLKLFEINIEVIKNDDSFAFTFDNTLPNFSTFKDGELISSDNTEKIYAKGSEQRVIFPNPNVKVGERAALIIRPKRLPM